MRPAGKCSGQNRDGRVKVFAKLKQNHGFHKHNQFIHEMPDAAFGGSMDDVKISPLAKRLAEENSIDWRQIHGTGPEGRVIERDILTYLAKVMSGEAELPYQPDVSEPPAPAGSMPDFGQIHSLAGASASLAKEGVDLSSMLADPVFNSAPAESTAFTSEPSYATNVQTDMHTDMRIDPVEDDLDDAIFDLDMDDDLEEPVVMDSAEMPHMSEMTDAVMHEASGTTDAAMSHASGTTDAAMSHASGTTDAMDMSFTPPSAAMPKPSDSADVVLEMDDMGDMPSPSAPHLDIHNEPSLSLDAFEPETASTSDFSVAGNQGFDFHLDDTPALSETHASDSHLDGLPTMDFGLSAPSEPSSFGSSFDLESEPSLPVFSMPESITPEPVMLEPVMLEPVLSEPVTPELVTPEPMVHEPEPVMPSFSAPLEMGLAAAAGFGAAHLTSDHQHHAEDHQVEPTPVISGAPETNHVASSVARDFFSVATLRRAFNTKPLLETAAQLAQAIDGHDVPLTPFLARAAGRGHFGSSLALGSLDGESLKMVAMPHLEGTFRDLIHTVQSAHLTSAHADLTVLDASGLGADDVVLPVGGALLALGRAHDGQATLTLSGKFDVASGGAFLERVAGMLENPVGLLV
jgi:e3 binding domain